MGGLKLGSSNDERDRASANERTRQHTPPEPARTATRLRGHLRQLVWRRGADEKTSEQRQKHAEPLPLGTNGQRRDRNRVKKEKRTHRKPRKTETTSVRATTRGVGVPKSDKKVRTTEKNWKTKKRKGVRYDSGRARKSNRKEKMVPVSGTKKKARAWGREKKAQHHGNST